MPSLKFEHALRSRSVLWAAFGVWWGIDLLTTLQFFRATSIVELNPITVLLYHLLGLPGVVLAATGYAGGVVLAVRASPQRYEGIVLRWSILFYGAFAIHNVSLLVGGVSLLGVYALVALTGALSIAVTHLTVAYERGFLNYLGGSRLRNPLALYCYGAVLVACCSTLADTATDSFVLAVGIRFLGSSLPPRSAEQVFAQFALGVFLAFLYWHFVVFGGPSRTSARA
ncbi:hypothetical protein D8Y22_05055 [Salinadaptatus halalkaliphilus]|uniref:DUF5658 domain-containing protein n=1 Tax=Salinadaptatus halalkaliphilus TaxID=2419781 RepID=A0A4S3TRE7_9EURY|nr:hypothetical protein D8Y22_05055 [Salinadaptatus halalkaliphilus]